MLRIRIPESAISPTSALMPNGCWNSSKVGMTPMRPSGAVANTIVITEIERTWKMIVISVRAIMIGNSGSQGAICLAGLLDGTALLDSVARRQLGDDGLELLPHGGGHVRRLQALGNVAAHGDRRRAIAATQDRVFHADLDGSDLRQRNPLAGVRQPK